MTLATITTVPIARALVHTISKLDTMRDASEISIVFLSVTRLPPVTSATDELASVIAFIPAITVLDAMYPARPKAIRNTDCIRMMLSTTLVLGLFRIEVRCVAELPDYPVYQFRARHA